MDSVTERTINEDSQPVESLSETINDQDVDSDTSDSRVEATASKEKSSDDALVKLKDKVAKTKSETVKKKSVSRRVDHQMALGAKWNGRFALWLVSEAQKM